MPFDNSKNQARARNMAEMLGHVETSAGANNATPAEVAAVLAPALEALERLGLEVRAGGRDGAQEPPQPDQERLAEMMEPPAEAPAQGDPLAALTAGQRAALHLSDRASLRELIAALTGRLEAHAARLDRQDREESE